MSHILSTRVDMQYPRVISSDSTEGTEGEDKVSASSVIYSSKKR